MKIKTLVAALLLTGGVSSAFAQTENCNSNSSISHEAVKAGNFKDAYAPCMAVLKDCPTLRYYTFKDALLILGNFMQQNKDKNSAEYKKYFDEMMAVHDKRIELLPEFSKKYSRGIPSEAAAKGLKAIDYLQYAPQADLNQAYTWLKECVAGEQGESDNVILHYFMQCAMEKVKADKNFTEEFFKDYMDAKKYCEEAIANETKPAKVTAYKQTNDNLDAMFIASGVASCDALQEIYGPKVEANKNDSTVLKNALEILKLMKCNECEAYFHASEYLYKINPTADAAVGVAYMYYKKGDYNQAVTYFDNALNMETDNAKKAEMAYATAAALFQAKKLSQARSYCQKAISFKEDYGEAYILLAQMYGSNPNWSDETALNKCTYFVVIDKLQRAKSIDPSVADKANELIATYARHTPQPKDLFMLGYKAGDRITIGGWIGESTTIR